MTIERRRRSVRSAQFNASPSALTIASMTRLQTRLQILQSQQICIALSPFPPSFLSVSIVSRLAGDDDGKDKSRWTCPL